MFAGVQTDRNGAEVFEYNLPEFPVYANDGRVSEYTAKQMICHWHDDFELNVVVSGKMGVYVDGEHIIMSEGQGIFINSTLMHYGYPVEGCDCEYRCVLIHPELFNNVDVMRRKYINTLISDGAFRYRLFDRRYVHDQAIISSVNEIFELFEKKNGILELAVTNQAFNVLEHLYHLKADVGAIIPQADQREVALRNMIAYVQQHYQEPVTLTKLAAAGMISKSLCNAIFREQLNQTPIGYLVKYRIDKSIELLQSTSMSVTDIAFAVGFNGQSYFSEIFHRHMGVSPKTYRQKHRERVNGN